jgi:RimJ/RimL family protein N-acetyltransferase
MGSDNRPIDPAQHDRWFAETVESAARLLLIVEHEGEPIGSVRFDALGAGSWKVSIYLVEPFTGRGLGTEALRLGRDLVRGHGAREVWAFVRDDNPRSIAAFRKEGYVEVAEPPVEAPPSHHALRLAV